MPLTAATLTKHIEARIDELKFYVAAHKAVYEAAKKFDGKVLNKRIDSVIKENIRAEGYEKAFGHFSKEYSLKFKVYNPYTGKEIHSYISKEDIIDNRFQFATWAARQNIASLEEKLNKLFNALKHVDEILAKHAETQQALKDYDTFLSDFGLTSYSDELRIS